MKNKTKKILYAVLALVILLVFVSLFFLPRPGGCNSTAPAVSRISYANGDKYTAGGAELDGVHSLDIDWVDGSVTLEVYDGETVKFSETCTGTPEEQDRLHYFLDDGTLRLRVAASGTVFHTGYQKQLTVKIPATLALQNTRIEVVSAKTELRGIRAGNLRIESVSGDVTVTDVTTSELRTETVSGDVTVNTLGCEKARVETVSGTVKLTVDSALTGGTLDVDTVSGDVTLYLPAELGFSASFGSLSGDLISRVDGTSDDEKHLRRGDEAYRIVMSSLSGDLTVAGR